MSKDSWVDPADWDMVCRRASGRRRYNSVRRFRAAMRRLQVARLVHAYGFEHGVQARIAHELGISEATVCRDLQALWREYRPCPCCGRGLVPRWQVQVE